MMRSRQMKRASRIQIRLSLAAVALAALATAAPSEAGPIGTFDTEMLQLDLTGGTPATGSIRLRESPTLPSKGKTSVTELSGASGPRQIDSFFDIWCELSFDAGLNWLPTTSPPMEIKTQTTGLPSGGFFDTEMLSMSLTVVSPLGPLMLRESPTLASLGKTKITDIGGGQFRIDSFFDVFTEFSIDGGATWLPNQGPPMELAFGPLSPGDGSVPEPASMTLLGLGIAGMAGYSWRRRKQAAVANS